MEATDGDDITIPRRLLEDLIGMHDDEGGNLDPVSRWPLTFNVDDGMGDGCWFCGAPKMRYQPQGQRWNPIRYADHKDDCAWVAACKLLGLDIGYRTPQRLVTTTTPTEALDVKNLQFAGLPLAVSEWLERQAMSPARRDFDLATQLGLPAELVFTDKETGAELLKIENLACCEQRAANS